MAHVIALSARAPGYPLQDCMESPKMRPAEDLGFRGLGFYLEAHGTY